LTASVKIFKKEKGGQFLTALPTFLKRERERWEGKGEPEREM
jgi:hypothetical protein